MKSYLRCFAGLIVTLSVLLPLASAPASAQTGTVIASDNFNRTDESPFQVGGDWGRTVAGNYDGFSVLTGSQVHSASNEGIYYWKGAGTFDVSRQFARERVVQKDGEQGLVLLGGTDQAIMVSWGPPGVGSTVYIYWYSGGIDRGQLATGPSTLANGDLIEAVLEGGRIYAKVNGVTVLSVANMTTLTSGTPGFITYLDPGLPGQVSIVDDWEAGTPVSYAIGGTITESATGLSGVLVTASGGFTGSTTTDGAGAYTLTGVPANAAGIVLTPSLAGHAMSPLTRTVSGPVIADVTGQDFTSTPDAGGDPTLIASDDFNRADEAAFAVGGNWQHPFTGGSASLTGAHVVGVSGEALHYWQGSGTFDNTHQFARAHVVDAGGQLGLVLLGAPNQAFVVAWHNGTLFFYWYSGGSYQSAILTVASTIHNGDVVEAMLEGGRFYAKINGTVVASVANGTSLTAGRPGFETFESGGGLDDWEAGTPQSYAISGTILESAAGLSGVLVTASGGFSSTATTNGSGAYTIAGVPPNATGIVLTPTLAGHTMSPLSRTVTGPVTADVPGQDFTSTLDGGGPPPLTVSDDFNRADETPLAVGGNWAQPFGGGAVNLTANHIASSSGEALYYWQGAGTFDNTRQYARAHVLSASGQVGLVLLGGTNRALVVSWGGGRLYIYWYLNGSHQGELANMAAALNDGDMIEAVLESGMVQAKVNGVVIKTVANTTSLTAGRPGFETYLSGAAFDDWEAGTPPSYAISGTITEAAVGLSGVLVTASGGFSGSATTDVNGAYAIGGVAADATGIVLTPTLSGHTMSPLTRTVAGPVTADVPGQDFTSTLNTTASLTVLTSHGNVTRSPDHATYALGTDVTLTPVPDVGYSFTTWSGNVPAGHETDNPLHVTMDQDRVITAHFVTPGVIASDDFNRADEMPFAVGGDWQRAFNGGFSNLAGSRAVGASGDGLYYWQGAGAFDNARQFARGRVVQASGQVGLVLLGGTGQAFVVSWNSGTLYFYWYTGGSIQSALTTVPSTLHDGDLIEALLEGGHVYAMINGALVANVTNTTSLTTGRPGFETYQSGAALDDWEAGTPPFQIVASAGTGGSISPSGTVTVQAGASQAFTLSPDAGYVVADVLVDGNSVGAMGSYTFTNVQANHAIAASFTPADRIAATPAPGSAISMVTPCLSVPVVFTRVIATPLLGYSVTLELSPNLTLCGAQFTSAGYTQAPRQTEVRPLGGNRWAVDEVTLGGGCGPTGSGTLFSVEVSSAETNGVGTLTVVSASARDCGNQPIPAYPGAIASVTIDREGPARTLDLVAIQSRTGNYVPPPAPSHATTPLQLQFTRPADAATVEIYRRPYGGYPQFDENGGADPALPAALPGAGWTLTAVTTSGASDEPATRDFWYYALVTRDAYGNPSAVSNMTSGTLDYYLGDISNGLAACAGDDHVDLADISLLGFHYGNPVAVNDAAECLDVGPTTDHSPDGRPTTDNVIQFEDLVMFALNYGAVSNPLLAVTAGAPVAATGDAERLSLTVPQQAVAGTTIEARIQLYAGGRLHALSVALEWDRSVVEPLDIRSGGFLEGSGGVTFAAGPAAMDGAVLGRARPALAGDGDFAIVRFRASRDGDPGVRIAQAIGRDRDNKPIALDELLSAPPQAPVTETGLMAAMPAPFRSQTAIGYGLAVESDVELAVFGIDGRRVRTLEHGRQSAGVHRITWDGTDDRGRSVAAGVYYTRLAVGSRRFTHTLIRLAH